jgi:hypothetical protein
MIVHSLFRIVLLMEKKMKKLILVALVGMFSFSALTALATVCKKECAGSTDHKACIEKCSNTSLKLENK